VVYLGNAVLFLVFLQVATSEGLSVHNKFTIFKDWTTKFIKVLVLITDHRIDFSVGICSDFFRTSEVSSSFPCLRYGVNYKDLYIFSFYLAICHHDHYYQFRNFIQFILESSVILRLYIDSLDL